MYRYTSLMLGVIIVAATDSFAKWKAQYDHNPPEIQAWYRAQINAQGVACCDQSDGHPYFGKYRLTADGGVELQLKGGPHKLPSYMVLKGPNPTGHAVWWYTDGGIGHTDFCFAPGALH